MDRSNTQRPIAVPWWMLFYVLHLDLFKVTGHIHSFIHSFTHSFVSLIHHKVRSNASSFNFHCSLLSLMSSSSCLHLLLLLSVTFMFRSVCCFNASFIRQFLHNIQPIQLAFLLFTVDCCMAILNSTSRVHLALFVIMLFKIFHIFHLCLIYHTLYWRRIP